MANTNDPSDVLAAVATAARLREGPAGVAALLRVVHRLGPGPLNQVAREARLPVPVASAVRRELEKAGLLDRTGGVSLTEAGRRLVEDGLDIRATIDPTCGTCGGTGLAPADPAFLALFSDLLTDAPAVDVTLDQAPCTPETSLRRAALMHQAGAIEGRRILVLGDDDSVSLALALFSRHRLGRALRHPVTVLELDPNRVAFLQTIAADHDLPIQVIAHDLRDPLPPSLDGAFDVFETDPPYTLPGADLFLTRAREALSDETGTLGVFSYADRPGQDQFDLLSIIADAGFAVTAMRPGFNRYEGAAILGSIGQLMELTAVGEPVRPGTRVDGALYSAEVNPRVRRYRCRGCGAIHTLGTDGIPETIEALKTAGCPACGGRVFRRLAGQAAGGAAAPG